MLPAAEPRAPEEPPDRGRARAPLVAAALRGVLREGYGKADLRADLLAGSVVGIVALPLSMALAIAVGAPPERGLYTAIVAGALTALLGGCRFQVTGPTAAFVVVLAPIASQHGLPGLLTAGWLAGLFLVAMGLARLGNLIQYIPHPVTTGFTAGIGVVIALLQLKDALGLTTGPLPEHFLEKLGALWGARGTARLPEAVVAAATLALLLTVPRVIKRVPAPLVAIAVVSAATAGVTALYPSLGVATVGSRFSTVVDGVVVPGIPTRLPTPDWPWGGSAIGFAELRELVPAAFAIALLAAIESLLSAVIADGMTGKRHDPNSELLGLGVGNLVAPFFGGIAATGALARTATNVRSGARSPLAAVWHAVFVLGAMLAVAPLLAYVPMACLAGLLLLVAWNMAEARHFVGLLKVAPRSDKVVLLTCFSLTVFIDMVAAISVGVVLAALLFMRRMAALTEARLELQPERTSADEAPAPGVALYSIDGPLFFGAAQRAMEALSVTHEDTFRVLVLDLGRVPAIDATGFVALEAALETLEREGKRVVVAGPLPRPREIFTRAALDRRFPGLEFADDRAAALARARQLAG